MLDAGNMLFKSRQNSSEDLDRNMAKAEMIWATQTAMGLQGFTPGPLDFAGGLPLLEKLRDQGKVPFLAANLEYPDGKPFSDKRYVLFERNGVRVAVFGLVSTEIFSMLAEGRQINLKVTDPEAATRLILKELEGQADVIVLLSELGKQELENFCELFPQVKFAIAGNNVVGFSSRARQIFGTYVLQGISRGKSISRLDLNVKDEDFNLVDNREYDVAKRSFERYDSDLKRMQEQAGGQDPDEFFKDDQRQLARYRRIKENHDKYEQMLKGLDPDQSSFQVGQISLGKSVASDPAIQALIEAFEREWGSDYGSSDEHASGAISPLSILDPPGDEQH